jgi:hypothetical protein
MNVELIDSFTSKKIALKITAEQPGEGFWSRAPGSRSRRIRWVRTCYDSSTLAEAPFFPTCREPLITNAMWRNIGCQWAYQMVILLVLQYKGAAILDLPPQNFAKVEHGSDNSNKQLICMIFNSFVFCQVGGWACNPEARGTRSGSGLETSSMHPSGFQI